MDDNWHIQLIADLLEFSWMVKDPEVCRRHVFNLPPDSLKTHICSVSLPTWILGRDPSRDVLIVSETYDHALEIRERCAELMGSKRYRSLFPDTRVVSGKKGLELSHGGRIRHVGARHSLPSRRSDLVIIDNPQSLQSLDRFPPESFLEIDRTLKKPKEGMIVVATRRLGENDLSDFLGRREGWTIYRFPILSMRDLPLEFPPDVSHLWRKGEPLHPRESWDEIEEKICSLRGEAFSWQYMQGLYRPRTRGERISHVDGNGLIWKEIGNFDPTHITLENLGKLRTEYLENLSV